jgi:DNA-binding NtrC family response regulator
MPERPRPISILLASDDIPFVDKLTSAAADRGVSLHHVPAEMDVDVALARHGANIYVHDAHTALRRGARSATAFAARHPGIPVIVLADHAAGSSVGGLPVLDKLRSTERLLGAIELAYAELRSTP